MRFLNLCVAALALAAPLAVADHETDSLASLEWTGTVYAEHSLAPLYPHQCFDVEVHAGPGAALAEASLMFGDVEHPMPLALQLDEQGAAQTSVCHAYGAGLGTSTTALYVETVAGAVDLDCLDVHWLFGPTSPGEVCSGF